MTEKHQKIVTYRLERHATLEVSVLMDVDASPDDWEDDVIDYARDEVGRFADEGHWEVDYTSTQRGFDPTKDSPDLEATGDLDIGEWVRPPAPPPATAWMDIDGTDWATDGHVMVRRGSAVLSSGTWCQAGAEYPRGRALPDEAVVRGMVTKAPGLITGLAKDTRKREPPRMIIKSSHGRAGLQTYILADMREGDTVWSTGGDYDPYLLRRDGETVAVLSPIRCE